MGSWFFLHCIFVVSMSCTKDVDGMLQPTQHWDFSHASRSDGSALQPHCFPPCAGPRKPTGRHVSSSVPKGACKSLNSNWEVVSRHGFSIYLLFPSQQMAAAVSRSSQTTSSFPRKAPSLLHLAGSFTHTCHWYLCLSFVEGNLISARLEKG